MHIHIGQRIPSGVVLYRSYFFFQAEDGIRDYKVTGVQTCALPISDTTRPARKPENRQSHNKTTNAARYLVDTKTMEYINSATIEIRKRPPYESTILRSDHRRRFVDNSTNSIAKRPPDSSTAPFKENGIQRSSASNCRRRTNLVSSPSYQYDGLNQGAYEAENGCANS